MTKSYYDAIQAVRALAGLFPDPPPSPDEDLERVREWLGELESMGTSLQSKLSALQVKRNEAKTHYRSRLNTLVQRAAGCRPDGNSPFASNIERFFLQALECANGSTPEKKFVNGFKFDSKEMADYIDASREARDAGAAFLTAATTNPISTGDSKEVGILVLAGSLKALLERDKADALDRTLVAVVKKLIRRMRRKGGAGEDDPASGGWPSSFIYSSSSSSSYSSSSGYSGSGS